MEKTCRKPNRACVCQSPSTLGVGHRGVGSGVGHCGVGFGVWHVGLGPRPGVFVPRHQNDSLYSCLFICSSLGDREAPCVSPSQSFSPGAGAVLSKKPQMLPAAAGPQNGALSLTHGSLIPPSPHRPQHSWGQQPGPDTDTRPLPLCVSTGCPPSRLIPSRPDPTQRLQWEQT